MTTVDLAAMEAAAPGRLAWTASTDDLPEHAGLRLDATFAWRDPTGVDVVGAGRVWLPATLADGAQAPLLHVAGYEMFAPGAVPWLADGFVVATPVTPEPGTVLPGTNPISRGLNLDVSFLHAMRLAPFVDDAKVFLAGGSAGGYMTLMLAAETFPLAGAIPEVPVVNLGYTAAFWLANHALAATPDDAGTPAMPYLASLKNLGDEAVALYGQDTDAEVFLSHSPVGQLHRITCPVSVAFSTADDLVPIEQVSEAIARLLRDGITSGLVVAPEALGAEGPGRVRLLEALDALGPERYEVTAYPIPDSVERRPFDDPTFPDRAHKVAVAPSARPWTVAILDEGGLDEDVPHYRYNIVPVQEAFWRRCLADPLGLDQLDAAKLDLLVDRWMGREWMAGGPPQLDAPEAERADVARGLRTWRAQSPAHAERLRDLYATLPEERQVLPPDILA